ncbi:hypothetical protein HYU18_03860 [Candidatus Woesearchaeota archaeon]|nr:hypothetical protein [Candidatus Woesearchaeota archaeon]
MVRKEFDGLIKQLAEFLGPEFVEVINELRLKSDYSEFKLAEAVKKDVNETRNLLYRLHDASLATFIKKKDHKIGWYIYYWTFQDDKVVEFLLSEKKAKLDGLKERVSRQGNSKFYSCVNKCLSVDFDRAFEMSFHCPECGSLLEQENNLGKVTGWEKEIGELEEQVGALEKIRMGDRAAQAGKNAAAEDMEKKAKSQP